MMYYRLVFGQVKSEMELKSVIKGCGDITCDKQHRSIITIFYNY